MGAIAWSYAALCHLGLDPAVVFHADGYLGASAGHIENFTAGHAFGVPILQWRGLAARDDEPDLPAYPRLRTWVCD